MSENSHTVMENLKDQIRSFVKQVDCLDKNYIEELVDESIYENSNLNLSLDDTNSTFIINNEELQDINEEEQAEIEKFNEEMKSIGKEYLIKGAFHGLLKEILDSFQNANENELTQLYNELALILDYAIYLILKNDSRSKIIKHVFYSSIQQVYDQLLHNSTFYANTFWTYMETREKLYRSRIYINDKSERVQFLYCFQPLINKYQIKSKPAKSSFSKSVEQESYDSLKQDTYNDRFRYRVRAFMSNCLSFEDPTGLNKFFEVANREPINLKIFKDNFLDDLLDVQRLLNNPVYFLQKSNFSQLKSLTMKAKAVYFQLLEEEIKYLKTKDHVDYNIITKPKSESELLQKQERFAKKTYEPETYFVSSFNSNSSKLEEEQIIDQKYLTTILEIPRVRMEILISFLMLAFFFIEFAEKSKKELLGSIKAPSTVKHFTDDVTPNSLFIDFLKIKQTLMKDLKQYNSQFAYMINSVQLSEKIMWGFLLYGKDPKTNKSIFDDKLVSKEELDELELKFKDYCKYRTTKLFQTYITPEVTRKMKHVTDKTKKAKEFDIYMNNESLENVKYEIDDMESNGVNDEKLLELNESRSALTWRLLRAQRHDKLFEISKILKDAIPIKENGGDDIEMMEEDIEIDDESVEKLSTEVEIGENGDQNGNEATVQSPVIDEEVKESLDNTKDNGEVVDSKRKRSLEDDSKEQASKSMKLEESSE